jgi:hypothetical protein
MDILLLWHIPLSHYNEKVRWALDYKRIAHHRQVLGADYLPEGRPVSRTHKSHPLGGDSDGSRSGLSACSG